MASGKIEKKWILIWGNSWHCTHTTERRDIPQPDGSKNQPWLVYVGGRVWSNLLFFVECLYHLFTYRLMLPAVWLWIVPSGCGMSRPVVVCPGRPPHPPHPTPARFEWTSSCSWASSFMGKFLNGQVLEWAQAPGPGAAPVQVRARPRRGPRAWGLGPFLCSCSALNSTMNQSTEKVVFVSSKQHSKKIPKK